MAPSLDELPQLAQLIINVGIPATYVLLGLTLLAVIVLPLIKSFDDPATMLKSGIGFGAIALLFLIGYSLSGNEVTPKFANFHITETLSQIIGGSLIMMYILGGITLVALIYAEVSRLFK
jgi:hypothetical protein